MEAVRSCRPLKKKKSLSENILIFKFREHWGNNKQTKPQQKETSQSSFFLVVLRTVLSEVFRSEYLMESLEPFYCMNPSSSGLKCMVRQEKTQSHNSTFSKKLKAHQSITKWSQRYVSIIQISGFLVIFLSGWFLRSVLMQEQSTAPLGWI